MRVCYIDDCEADRVIFGTFAEGLGLGVDLVRSINDVSGRYDVIFTDLNMEGQNKGIVALERLQQYGCPIVVVSGIGYDSDQAYMCTGLIEDFIQKSDLSPSRLLSSIKKVKGVRDV